MTIIASDFSWDLKIAALAAVSSAAFPVVEGTFHSHHLPKEDRLKWALMKSKMTNPVKRKILKEQGAAWNQTLLLPLKCLAINISAGFKQAKLQHSDYLQSERQ